MIANHTVRRRSHLSPHTRQYRAPRFTNERCEVYHEQGRPQHELHAHFIVFKETALFVIILMRYSETTLPELVCARQTIPAIIETANHGKHINILELKQLQQISNVGNVLLDRIVAILGGVRRF